MLCIHIYFVELCHFHDTNSDQGKGYKISQLEKYIVTLLKRGWSRGKVGTQGNSVILLHLNIIKYFMNFLKE